MRQIRALMKTGQNIAMAVGGFEEATHFSPSDKESDDEGDDTWAINLLEELGDDGEALASEDLESTVDHDSSLIQDATSNLPETSPSGEADLELPESQWIDNIENSALDIETNDGQTKQTRHALFGGQKGG